MDTEISLRLYGLISRLPRHGHAVLRSTLPANGIYFFFERDETIQVGAKVLDRIVRVGINTKDGRFRDRIRGHYGPVHSLGGNKNGSVFRKHLGTAIMRSCDVCDPRLPGWLKQDGPTDRGVEKEVSAVLQENFTFCYIQVDNAEERQHLEAGLIGLLAQCPMGNPSPTWLGRHAASPNITHSGLWNILHLHSEPITPNLLLKISGLAAIRGGICDVGHWVS